ncbi:peptidyl-prolyl cis-trans isomerase C [Geothermobacter ehrlichii]|uniref:Peptidyl-prolyl cis-trans isomerase C n=1 Tax=Geothermobacter ehrlichii TaxID=213224 RepID=A0A5D3WMH3_9BACT|nr:peptidylprolyl isomerase [Geothermobacter ehrlichii]TYO99633.1 peptidyl-prolyl cis-trans isomerase C [Geothermobacter ehrlichii]
MDKKQQCVARVNGTPISRFDLENAMQGYAMQEHRKTLDQLDADQLREAESFAMEKLIARELIFQQALAEGFVADEAAIAEELRKIVDNFPSEEEFHATLAKAGLSAADYQRMLRQDVTVNQMSEKYLADLDDPSDEEIEDFYRQHADRLVRRGRVRASHLLVRAGGDNREQALERIRRLRDEATADNFADLARKHSDCPSAPGGGDLGYFRRGDMVKPFEDAAFSLAVGAISEPVETQFGFHLIRVLDREEDRPLTREEARPQIVSFIRQQAGAGRLKQWVEELRAQADIEIMDNRAD